MALSQDEQRILAEIERRLAGDDPGLASSLTAFRRPPAKMLRSPRARIVGSLFTVLLVAMVSLTIYAMIPFRAQMGGKPAATTSSSGIPARTAMSDASTSHSATAAPGSTQPAAATSVSASNSATSAQSGSSSSATALADQQQAKATATLLLPSGKP